ncbi:hypothetical protein Pint_01065 [Pistacia integerrima]|uniref:Uncharacterized protein n=1 Tax=Pistacia integerrima TaxID=434235 RepID=A0ACC0ZLD0_9ROSI|nr:hypothetical protein Pint_01065 [Pistacia integerrima]
MIQQLWSLLRARKHSKHQQHFIILYCNSRIQSQKF